MSRPKQSAYSAQEIVGQWYAEYFQALVRHIRARFGAGPPEPEDIAQRTFGRLLNRSTTLHEIDNPKAFLWRIAHNLLVSEHRAIAANTRGVEALSTIEALDEGYLLIPERVLEAGEQLNTAIRVLERMPKRRRQVLLMTRVDGLTQREVASTLGISTPAVSKHLARATADLYDALIAHPPEEPHV